MDLNSNGQRYWPINLQQKATLHINRNSGS